MNKKTCGCGKETKFTICENGHVNRTYNVNVCYVCENETLNTLCSVCVRTQTDEAQEELKQILSDDQLQKFEDYQEKRVWLTSMTILD